MERVTGIEPVYSAWKAAALPLSYTRTRLDVIVRGGFDLNLFDLFKLNPC